MQKLLPANSSEKIGRIFELVQVYLVWALEMPSYYCQIAGRYISRNGFVICRSIYNHWKSSSPVSAFPILMRISDSFETGCIFLVIVEELNLIEFVIT
jgi:hypothetical protein